SGKVAKMETQHLTLDEKYRVSTALVLRHLDLLKPDWLRARLSITADLALVAGCLDILPNAGSRPLEEVARSASIFVGKEYAAGFRDGFDCELPTRKNSYRYVQGLEDGGLAGRAVRHHLSR